MGSVKLGIGCEIHDSVFIHPESNVSIGDHVYLGPGVRIMPGDLSIGDYSKIHQDTFINPMGGIVMGECTWIGQNCIIDGTGGICMGDFVGIGMYSHLYSHIRQGDISMGCRFERNKKLVIEDDVWFVGMCLVSPIIAKKKSMAMLGSVVTKNMLENRTYGGNPCVDITHKVGPQFETPKERLSIVKSYIDEFCSKASIPSEGFEVVDSIPDTADPSKTYYDVVSRTYTKTNRTNEVMLNKWMFKYRSKFKSR